MHEGAGLGGKFAIRFGFVVALAALLSGCVTAGAPPIARSLPPPPASMQRVAMPTLPKAGADVRPSLYEHRAALATANRRLGGARKWYDGVRSDYSKAK